MNLPIDVISERPLKFRWRHITTTPVGDRSVEYEGALGATVDGCVADLIAIAKQLALENEELRRKVKAMEVGSGGVERATQAKPKGAK